VKARTTERPHPRIAKLPGVSRQTHYDIIWSLIAYGPRL
jgi:hypothetical protein